MTTSKEYVVHTPLFPTYSEVRKLLDILANKTKKGELLEMMKAIWDQTGTPQNQIDWSDPDHWIGERLKGKEQELAARIWKESSKTINPRHMYGAYSFINMYELLKPDQLDLFRISEVGQGFKDNDATTLRKLDEAEGLPKVLAIVAAHSPAKRADLIDEWGEFLLAHSKYGTPSTIKDTLRRRILNLVEREYIHREGNTYTITDKGVAYAADPASPTAKEPHHQVLTAIKQYNDAQTKAFREQLATMNAYRFESLIKDLLEAMDYEDVVVTKQSGDKGIDVVGYFQFGITQIKEVVQVKRQQSSVTRPVLDQLRGALPYHQAIRGTIITLGKFAKGCENAALYPGAAPITLIDGDKLIELLLKHNVGVKKRPQTLIEIDESYFAGVDPESAIETAD